MTVKQQVIDAVQGLPNKASLADIQYSLDVIASVNKGRNEIRLDKGISHLRAREILRKKWNIK